jgi:hypothetical protein
VCKNGGQYYSNYQWVRGACAENAGGARVSTRTTYADVRLCSEHGVFSTGYSMIILWLLNF